MTSKQLTLVRRYSKTTGAAVSEAKKRKTTAKKPTTRKPAARKTTTKKTRKTRK